MRFKGRLLILLVLILAALVAAPFGVRWWSYRQSHVSTDDAYVRAPATLVTPRVSGTVTELAVEDNWQVVRGDLLVRLDSTLYEARLRAAEAGLAQAEQQVEEARAGVRTAQSEVALAEAQLEQAHRDAARVEKLAGQKVASVDDLDRSRTSLRVARSRLEAAKQELGRSRAALGIPLDDAATDSPLVRRAGAARDEAALMLSYAEIRSPVAGIVASRGVELGQRVERGQPLMRIVPLDRAYVEANFKETQMKDVRVGQYTTVVADIYPGTVYHGVVESIAPGTGSAFSLLPPENATGNWIKVVQRLPVKIRLEQPFPPDKPLRLGLSVAVIVDVTDVDGPVLVPLDQTARDRHPDDETKASRRGAPHGDGHSRDRRANLALRFDPR